MAGSSGSGSDSASAPQNNHQTADPPQTTHTSRLRCNKTSRVMHISGARPYKQFLHDTPIYLHNENTPTATRGRTWIELLIIFHMMGFSTPAPQTTSSQAIERWSLGQCLQHFRLQIRRMVKVLCPASQQGITKGQARGQPLLHLGITTHLTTLPITIHLTPAAEEEIATRIIQSQTSCSHKAAVQKLQDKHWVIQHRLRTRGRTKWLASLREWTGDLFHSSAKGYTTSTTKQTKHSTNTKHSSNNSEAPDTSTQVRLPDIILLHCPTCRHAVDGTRDKFDIDKLNHRTWCKACRRQKFVHLWQCRCGVPWHTCPTHQGEPARLRRDTPPKTTTTTTTHPANNYLVGNSSTQQWLKQTTNKHKHDTDIIIFTKQDEDRAKAMIHRRSFGNPSQQTNEQSHHTGGARRASAGTGASSAQVPPTQDNSQARPGGIPEPPPVLTE